MSEEEFREEDKTKGVNLMPQYFAARRVSENILKKVNADIFNSLIENATKDLYSKLSDTINDYLISDQEINIQYYINNMVEQTIQALLSGEEWAMKAYPFTDYSRGEKIRAEVAKHGKDELLLKRIEDLEKELTRTKEMLAWEEKITTDNTKALYNDFEVALNRLSSDASYGIRSDDHELMNPENYKKQMKQHYEDVKLLERLVKTRAQEFSLADGMITRYEELEVEYNQLQAENARLRAVLQGIANNCSNAPEVARRVLNENK